MTDLATVHLTREEFVDWMAAASDGAPTLPSRVSGSASGEGSVTLTWRFNEPDARPIVCVPKRELKDFFAFVSTYIPTLRPYSAFFRVMPIELLPALGGRKRLAPKHELKLARAVTGAGIAEAYMRATRSSKRTKGLLPLLQASLSSVLGQTVLAGYQNVSMDWVASEWSAIHVRSDEERHDADFIKDALVAWRLVSQAVEESPGSSGDQIEQTIVRFIAAALREGGVRADLLRSLSSIAGPEGDLAQVLASSREERIGTFNSVLVALKRNSELGLRSQFAAGLLLAVAGNGSFEMLRSARELDSGLRGAVTWFGICAALFEESNVLNYADCSGRRLARDLLHGHNPFDLSSADIGSAEYQFIDHDRTALAHIGAHGVGFIDVEILPGVITRVPLESDDKSILRPDDTEKLIRSLQEIGYIAERAQRMLTDPDPERGARQRDLYPTRTRNRTR